MNNSDRDVAEQAGYRARLDGRSIESNPYTSEKGWNKDGVKSAGWRVGWMRGDAEMKTQAA